MFLQICDVVVVARLLNATLVIPEIQSTTSSKGIRLVPFLTQLHAFTMQPQDAVTCYVKFLECFLNFLYISIISLMLFSTEFKSFAYLYSEDQFMAALANDIRIVKTLPKDLKGARRKKEIPSFKVPNSASPYFYLHHVLPVLSRHSVVELVIPDGGCLQVP